MIKHYNQTATDIVSKLHKRYADGSMHFDQVTHILTEMERAGDISIHNTNRSFAKSSFDVSAKKRWEKKAKEVSNPLKNKGQSYADRVEGPDGWGQHVPVTRNDPDDDLDIPF